MTQTLYILCGLPYSGKTTLTKELVRRFGFAVVSVDDIMDKYQMHSDTMSQEDWNKVYSEGYNNLKGLLKKGKTVILDVGNLKRSERNAARDIAKSLRVQYKLIYLDASEKEIKQRFHKNAQTNDREQLSDSTLDVALNMFQEPTEDENPIVYNESIDLDKLIDMNVIYVFIDASNLWQAQKAKGRFLDYEKLIKYINQKYSGTSIKCFYYTAYPAQDTRNYSTEGKHKFYTFLKKGLGFEVVKKELKRINVIINQGQAIQEKGNMDVEITIDAIHNLNKYNTAVFFSGDSDFLALVSYLRRNGKKVYIFSSKNNVSQELRTGADGYTDVLGVNDDIWGRKLVRRSK